MMMTDVLSLLIVGVSLVAWRNPRWWRRMAFSPYAVAHHRQWDRWLTSIFVHADMWHLIVNVLVFYMFGREVEGFLREVKGAAGPWFFLGLFLAGGILSEVGTYRKHRNDPAYLSVGASGAVAAVLFASILLAPWATLLIWGILPVPAVVLGVGYLVFSAYMARKPDQHVNHSAHFWGSVVGVVYMLLIYPPLARSFIQQLVS